MTIIVAAIGAAVPGATAVNGWFTLNLAEKKQEFDMRTSLLDRAIEPSRSPKDRQQVLRFLVGTVEDPRLQTWARDELSRVENEVHELQEQLRLATDKLALAQGAVSEAHQNLATSKANETALSAQLDQAHATLAESQRKVDRVEQRLNPDREPDPVLRGSFFGPAGYFDVDAKCKEGTVQRTSWSRSETTYCVRAADPTTVRQVNGVITWVATDYSNGKKENCSCVASKT